MNHVKNKVEWCLRKAETEIKEGKKHRGLIRKNTDLEEARKHIEKAEHNLSAIDYFNIGGFSDWSMSAVFYCLYHCFLAIINKFGYESRNQECTIALIRHLKEKGELDIEEKFIEALEVYNDDRHESNIIERRETYTYGTTVSADDNELAEAIGLCRECLDQTKDIILK